MLAQLSSSMPQSRKAALVGALVTEGTITSNLIKAAKGVISSIKPAGFQALVEEGLDVKQTIVRWVMVLGANRLTSYYTRRRQAPDIAQGQPGAGRPDAGAALRERAGPQPGAGVQADKTREWEAAEERWQEWAQGKAGK